jgi:hypothetical protein
MHDLACEKVRALAFDHRRGDMQGTPSDWVDGHLAECGACRAWRLRLDGLIEGARSVAREPARPSDPDALFARIAEEVADGPSGDTAAQVAPSTVSEASAAGRRRGTSRWIAAGGALVAAAAVLLWVSTAPSGRVTVAPIDPVGPGAFERLAPASSPRASVRIFAAPGTRWSFAGAGRRMIVLESGTLLVAYAPGDEAQTEGRLRLVGPDFEIEVVGTVFFASTEAGGSVGVAAGTVDVRRDRGPPVRLQDGERLGERGEPAPIGAEILRGIEALVDLEAHRTPAEAETPPAAEDPPDLEPEALGRVADAPEPPRQVAARPRVRRAGPGAEAGLPSVEAPDDRDGAWAQAESALRAGDDAGAARILEALLEGLPPRDAAAGPVHLDLARLYAERLGRPERALMHLGRFVDGWPGDVAAPAARAELCRIAVSLGVDEPRCEAGR